MSPTTAGGGSATLILVRHGATAWNERRILNGTTDIPLSRIGRAQVEKLAARLGGLEVDRILSSSRQRAVATAEILAPSVRSQARAVEIDGRLDEINFQEFEGRAAAELEGSETGGFPVSVQASLDSAKLRAIHFLSDTFRAGTVTLAVSHGYLIRVLIAVGVVGLDLCKLRRLELASCGVSVVRGAVDFPRLLCFNGGLDFREYV